MMCWNVASVMYVPLNVNLIEMTHVIGIVQMDNALSPDRCDCVDAICV